MTGPETALSPAADASGAPGPVTLSPALAAALSPAARTWLNQALAQATGAAEAVAARAAHPTDGAPATPSGDAAAPDGPGPEAPAPSPRRLPAWELRFAEAGRRCGPQHADAARVLLLRAARPDTATMTRLYTHGSAAERRAVLLALHDLAPGPGALPLIEDALRTNDTRLVAAAVGPYAATHLDAHAWRHAILKCLFTGVSVDAVAELETRAREDAELARMLGDYAQERRAAGRQVPEDLYRVLDLTAVSTSPEVRTPQAGTASEAGADTGTSPALKAPSTGKES